MEYVRVVSFMMLLLPICGMLYQPDLQNVYPGCKSSPDQPDMSYPECNKQEFKQTIETASPEFNTFFLNTTRLTDCFTDNSSFIELASTFDGVITFDGPTSEESSFNCELNYCACSVSIRGPPESFYLITAELFNRESYNLGITINNGVHIDLFAFSNSKTMNSMNNDLVFQMVYTGTILGAMSFKFEFETLPACYQQLEVHCSTITSGYIETPDWGVGGKYFNNMKSCATLHVPENHVTMLSLINIDVDRHSYMDQLLLFKTANCTGSSDRLIFLPRDLRPTVIKDTDVLSFGFVTDSSTVMTGFRLLYSFHEVSEQPEELSKGKWDCNVSFFGFFQQHFTCVPESFCEDNSDKVDCPERGLCGLNLWTIDDSCYRIFTPRDRTTWNKASETCGTYGGDLAVLNRGPELKSIMDFVMETSLDKPIFIGLRIASSVKLNDMYQNTWLWADDTLALYLPIVFHAVDTPFCAALNHSNITVVTCDKPMDAAFLCETDTTPGVEGSGQGITLTSPSECRTKMMTTCGNAQFTHNFLACDVHASCLARSEEDTLPCSGSLSPAVPLFTCRNQIEHVPYSLVCDFRADCCDGSDEDFCESPPCDSGTHYQCATNKQCIDRDLLCNVQRDCVDETDELRCQDVLSSVELWTNTIEPPAQVEFTMDGNVIVRQLANNATCPETHYRCNGGGYCLPVYTRCNDFYDCPGKEDEMGCDHYTCPGYYRCRGSKICVHEKHLCDDVFHCPQRDDELMCNFTCPDSCYCYGHAFICNEVFSAEAYTELRYVDASNTGMKPNDFVHNRKLVHLTLRNCDIKTLGIMQFPNLQSLDLSFNDIRELSSSHLSRLVHLVYLSLSYNSIIPVDILLNTNLSLSSLIDLQVSGIALPNPTDTFFDSFPNVKILNMSDCGVKSVTERGFQSLNRLRSLDLRGGPMETFYPGVFEGLNQLEVIYTDNYQLCCPSVIPETMIAESCHAPQNEISSCDALLRKDVYRVFLTIYAILALTGNMGSFLYRVLIDKNGAHFGYEVFVTHLSVADFLMGVYLAIIGIADRIHYGNYRWHDEQWKNGTLCKLAGFLSFVSSEVSAFLICLITLERFLVIGFPYKNLNFCKLTAHVASVIVWMAGLILALVPLLPMYSHWNFYSQSGICIPLPITRQTFYGNDYAFGVMIVVNFVLFLFVAVGQALIYWSINFNAVTFKDFGRKARDTAVARRLLAVVMTDFICWFPIGVLGLMARSGVPISSDIKVAIAIFVLPFNSALNPFLYTINMVVERRRKMARLQKSPFEGERPSNQNKIFDVESEHGKDECNYSKEEALQLFKKFLVNGILTSDEIVPYVWDIYEI